MSSELTTDGSILKAEEVAQAVVPDSLAGLASISDNMARVLKALERLEQNVDQQRQEYLSISQAAAVCGVSGDHVRRAVVGGTLPCSNLGTPDRPLYRISRENIGKWMKEREAGPKPPPRRKKLQPAQDDQPDIWKFSRHRRPSKVATDPSLGNVS